MKAVANMLFILKVLMLATTASASSSARFGTFSVSPSLEMKKPSNVNASDTDVAVHPINASKPKLSLIETGSMALPTSMNKNEVKQADDDDVNVESPIDTAAPAATASGGLDALSAALKDAQAPNSGNTA